MKRFFHFTIFLLLCTHISCRLTNCDRESFDYTFEENKTIQLTMDSLEHHYNFVIIDGDSLVFEYARSSAQCDDIADDEYSEFVYFQVDPNEGEGEYLDAGLSSINCTYRESGAWVFSVRPVEKGRLNIEKINNKRWRIMAQLDIDSSGISGLTAKTVSFDETFNLQ